VLAFKRHLEGLGDEVTRKRITIPGDRRCETDLFNATRKQLFEAKDEASRDKIRLAIGQLADYMRFLADDVEAAVLGTEQAECRSARSARVARHHSSMG
jgi:hypothetical protein